jgi:ferredoxin
MKVVVDEHRCISAGNCVLAEPAVFAQREDDGVVVLLDENPPDELAHSVAEAIDVCPAQAIALA